MSDAITPIPAPSSRPDRCSICGAKFGIWSRLTGDGSDGVCSGCRRDGIAKAEQAAAAIGPDSDLPEVLAQLGSLAARYHIPEAKESRCGREILQRIAGRVV